MSDLQQLPFEVSGSKVQLKYRIHVKLQTGIVHFRLIRPDGVVIVDSAGKIFSQAGPKEEEHFPSGRYMAEIRAEQAIGTWTLAIHDGNDSSHLNSSAIITGKLMVLVGALALLFGGDEHALPGPISASALRSGPWVSPEIRLGLCFQ